MFSISCDVITYDGFVSPSTYFSSANLYFFIISVSASYPKSFLYMYINISNLSCGVSNDGISNGIAFDMFASFTPYSFESKSNINSFTYFLSFTSPYVQPFRAFFNSYFLFFLLFNSSSDKPISYRFTFVISSSLLFTNSRIFSSVYVLSSTSIFVSVGASFFFFMK